MDLQVTDNQAQSRFEIRADGELAGFAEYEMSGDEIVFIHTETEDRFRGHGLAGTLVQSALEEVRDRKLEVLPYCPFVRSWITEHREYADLVPADRRAQFGL
jgi:predicted GNAT family acetyltransferase